MAELRVGGVRLFVEEHGEGAPILLIHGTASSALGWGPAIERLAALGRVIAYDRRGYGRSEHPDAREPVGVSIHTEDAAGVLDALDATPAVVIGRSYGGEVSLDLALRHAGSVRALVLLEPALLNLDPEGRAWELSIRDRVARAAREDPGRIAHAFIEQVLGPERWDGIPGPIRRMLAVDGPTILAELEGARLDASLEQLARIEVPTLVVAGSDSPETFRAIVDVVARAIPRAETVIVPGGHLVDPASADVLRFVGGTLA